MKNESIDFVITWVDGSDSKWLADRAKYAPKGEKIDESRYRDWGFLRYWFRAVEANAPWVRKIHFVTYGHVPKWLNINNPKIHIVKHEDFIDKKYLPTFNSCAIEMNLHKIPGLSEKFVYFNDDTFLNKPVKPEFFFDGDKPRDTYVLSRPPKLTHRARFINENCNSVANKYKVRDNFSAFSMRNGFFMQANNLLITLLIGQEAHLNSKHAPASFLKESFRVINECERDLVGKTNSHRFREDGDISQWAIEFYQQRTGLTAPRNYRASKYYGIDRHNCSKLLKDISEADHSLICINDGESTEFNLKIMSEIKERFEKRYRTFLSFETIAPTMDAKYNERPNKESI